MSCDHKYASDIQGRIFCFKCNSSFTFGDANNMSHKLAEAEARVEELERKLRLYETASSYPRYE